MRTKSLSFQKSCYGGLSASYYRPRNRFLVQVLVIECINHCFFSREICILEMQLLSPLGYFMSQIRCLFLQEVFPEGISSDGWCSQVLLPHPCSDWRSAGLASELFPTLLCEDRDGPFLGDFISSSQHSTWLMVGPPYACTQ